MQSLSHYYRPIPAKIEQLMYILTLLLLFLAAPLPTYHLMGHSYKYSLSI